MAWIVVDPTGRRFMNENHPYTQDTNHRPMELFDTATQSFPRVPSYMICDEDDDFGRPPGSMAPIRTPPFYAGEVWPVDRSPG